MNETIVVNNEDYVLSNAMIKSTNLGFEDHGIMTLWLHLEYRGGSGQGAGGYALDEPIKLNGSVDRIGSSKGMDLIIKILNVVGVKSWEDLPGKYIRVYSNHNRVGAIFNILDDRGIWFSKHFNVSE